MTRTKVYYNSACPVCDAGIRRQRRKLDGCNEPVEWIDVRENNEAVGEIGASLEFVRERLHVVDQQGNAHVGADAIAELMTKTPGQRRLARFVRLPGLLGFLRIAYNCFAAMLYRWNRRAGRW